MRYAIIIDKTENNYGAWVPDLPGYIASGKSVEVVQRRIREAIALHLAGMREDGDKIPSPTVQVEYVDVAP